MLYIVYREEKTGVASKRQDRTAGEEPGPFLSSKLPVRKCRIGIGIGIGTNLDFSFRQKAVRKKRWVVFFSSFSFYIHMYIHIHTFLHTKVA